MAAFAWTVICSDTAPSAMTTLTVGFAFTWRTMPVWT
jgi:hypothetical protein